MSFHYIQRMPSSDQIIEEIPVSARIAQVKQQRDQEIAAIITGSSDKFLLIIGPCSAHNEDAVFEYVSRLAALQEKVKDKLVLVPRIYTNKPRTTGEGYKGMAHQPDPMQKPDMVKGVKMLRWMHIRAIEESGLTAADEMLYPDNYSYLADLLSYVAVGARSVENQQHRLTISGLDIPAGMKNPTSGDVSVMLNAITAAQMPHVFTYNGYEAETSGNPLVHAVVRGFTDKHGQHIPNYHFEDLSRLAEIYCRSSLTNPVILVDTNHSNSGKDFQQQPRIAKEIMSNRAYSSLLRKTVRGLMIESFLVGGSQPVDGAVYGKSITDPCLGWEESEQLLLELAELA